MRTTIVVAHSLGLYASALVGLLKELRPDFDVERVEIGDLDDRVANAPTALVIADRVSDQVRSCSAAHILYYPDLTNVVVINAQGPSRTIENPAWDDLVAAIDYVAAEIVAKH